MSFLLNPFVFAGAAGDFEPIATVTVGAGGASSIEFTSIPGTYQHLQIRGIAATNRATYGQDDVKMQVGNSTIDTGNNYSWHSVRGSGASASAAAGSSQSVVFLQGSSGAAGGASMFGALVIDILDYASTSKYKTVRVLRGIDTNGAVAGYAGFVGIDSGLWQSASAIDRIKFDPTQNGASGFAQHSTFALYGIKA